MTLAVTSLAAVRADRHLRRECRIAGMISRVSLKPGPVGGIVRRGDGSDVLVPPPSPPLVHA